MTEHLPDPLHLTRCDPDLNMARFYVMSIEPTLFGEVTLVRSWGRIGSRGQVMMETFAEVQKAAAAADRLRRVKRRRGYAEVAARA
jgi:predicted DNA-binding WGR domain protein